MRKVMRRVRLFGPEEKFLNGLLLFVALALIVVGVWRMGTEPRAGSSEVKAERIVATTSTTRATATTTTTKATVRATAVAASDGPTTTTAPRNERERRPRRARTTATTLAPVAAPFVGVPPVQLSAPPVVSPPTTRPTPTTTPTTQPTSTTTRPRPGDEIVDPVAP